MPSPSSSWLRRACALAGAALVAAACSGSGEDAAGTTAASTTRKAAPPELTLEAGPIDVQSVGPNATLDPKVIEAVLASADAYLTGAVLDPVVTGQPVEELEQHFAPPLWTRVADGGADRAALTDEGLPSAAGEVTVTATPAAVTALTDGAGIPLLVTVTTDVDLDATTDDGALTIHRTNELTFEPVGGGKWLVAGYRVGVERDGAGVATTTTTSAATATTGARS